MNLLNKKSLTIWTLIFAAAFAADVRKSGYVKPTYDNVS